MDLAGSAGNLIVDVKGLTIYYARNGSGYLIVTSQSNNRFVLYRRKSRNPYFLSFEIVSSPGVDGITSSDGIDASNFPLESTFPFGVFVGHAGRNEGGHQNYKLLSWEAIANSVNPPLSLDTLWNPRQPNLRLPCSLDPVSSHRTCHNSSNQ